MAFTDVLGRGILVLIFVIAGCLKFTETPMYAGLLADCYSKFYALVSTTWGIHLPINPSLVSVYSPQLIYCTACLQLIGSLLTLLRFKAGPFIIISLLVLFNLIIHNPFIYSTDPTQMVFHTRMTVLNFAIAGGFFVAM